MYQALSLSMVCTQNNYGDMELLKKIHNEGKLSYLYDLPNQGGELICSEMQSIDSLALFYEGEGNQLKISMDIKRSIIACYAFKDGYRTVLFERKFKTLSSTSLEICYTRNWVEVRCGGCYMGSSYVEPMKGESFRVNVNSSNFSPADRFTAVPFNHDLCKLFIGDGFTGGNWPHVNYWMWPDLVVAGSKKFLNAGISAANTRRVCQELSLMFEQSDEHYEECYVMVGVDDVIDMISPKETQENYKYMIEVLLQKCKKIYVLTLTPRKDNLNVDITKLNEFIMSLKQIDRVEVIDIYGAFENADIGTIIQGADFPAKLSQQLIADTVLNYLDTAKNYRKLPTIVDKDAVIVRLLRCVSNKLCGLAFKIS